MAEPHAHSQPILTYGAAPHNRNIWPHNSRATVFCLRFWPILLFALVPAVYPLLTYSTKHGRRSYGGQRDMSPLLFGTGRTEYALPPYFLKRTCMCLFMHLCVLQFLQRTATQSSFVINI